MTKKEMFNHIATVNASDAEIVEFCNKEIELLEKRSGKKAPTKVQKENEGIKEVILEVLSSGDKMTVGEMLADDRLADYSSQKLSALLKQLVEAGKAEKVIEKKKSYFFLAG